MAREVTDAAGTVWSVTQAFAGVAGEAAAQRGEAAAQRGASRPGHVSVVFTPNGGAQSVHGELPLGWETGTSDDAVLAALADGIPERSGADE